MLQLNKVMDEDSVEKAKWEPSDQTAKLAKEVDSATSGFLGRPWGCLGTYLFGCVCELTEAGMWVGVCVTGIWKCACTMGEGGNPGVRLLS